MVLIYVLPILETCVAAALVCNWMLEVILCVKSALALLPNANNIEDNKRNLLSISSLLFFLFSTHNLYFNLTCITWYYIIFENTRSYENLFGYC